MPTAELRDAAVTLDSVTIADGAEEVIDSLDPAEVRSAKWFVTFTDSIDNKYNVAEISAVHDGTTASFSVSNKIGDFIPYRTSVVLDNGEFQCKVQNNHTEDLRVDIIRISNLI